MWQWILTGLIVCAALVYAVVKIAKTIQRTTQKAADCDGCSSDCTDCPLNPDAKNSNRIL